MNRTVCNTVCLYTELLIQTDQTNNPRCDANGKEQKMLLLPLKRHSSGESYLYLFSFVTCHFDLLCIALEISSARIVVVVEMLPYTLTCQFQRFFS